MRHTVLPIALLLAISLAGGCEDSDDGDGEQGPISYGSGLPEVFQGGSDGGGFGGGTHDAGGNVDGGPIGGTKDSSEPGPDAVGDVAAPQDTGGGGTGQTDIDVSFTEPDGECVPQCEGRICGPDGCGNICGFCTTGNACTEDGTECKPICDPITPCQGKVCGPDGCGGVCGDCDANFACGEDGQCYPDDCQPLCEGKNCGPDKCGGQCGKCPGTKLCDIDIGQCVDNPCDDIGAANACKDFYTLQECKDSQIVETDCRDESPLFACTWIKNTQKYGCDKPPECEPDCAGKQCGTDGCGGSCGSGCFEGWTCETFQCVPQVGGACGTLTLVGKCINNKNFFCSEGVVSVEDCEALGKKCGYNNTTAKNECKAK